MLLPEHQTMPHIGRPRIEGLHMALDTATLVISLESGVGMDSVMDGGFEHGLRHSQGLR